MFHRSKGSLSPAEVSSCLFWQVLSNEKAPPPMAEGYNVLARRAQVIQSDIFSNIKEKYDFILANPPYIARNRINKVQKCTFSPRVSK